MKAGQSSLHPASHAANEIAYVWWVMLIGAAVGLAVVSVLLFLGWWRRNRPNLPFGGGDRAATAWIVALGVAVPLVVLSVLFVWADIFVINSTAAPKQGTTQLTVDVIGHQFWWEARYPGSGVVTANEIHIPAGERVLVVATTDDVIHSFWVPELNRKIDMIPGQHNEVLLDAEHPGAYRGQCAEFCGLQHALMSFVVYADPPAAFHAWLAAQERPAATPANALAQKGRDVFLSESCADCHQIRGTSADGQVGPDLTHLASRHSLAANTIANDPADLAEWIRDPQHVKPGNRMPDVPLSNGQVAALVAYLETLR
ncbi:MAG TPA: cytochrome c oxidase subunit II [Gaiellaceae bacterium]|nr:cytochrome c oxidase subunit II [Gaiellaceae bacterium]